MTHDPAVANITNTSSNPHNNPAYEETLHASADGPNLYQSSLGQKHQYAYADGPNRQAPPVNNENEYAYAFAETSERPGSHGPSASPQFGSQHDQEGWKENSVYVTSNKAHDKSGTAGNAGEGWADNSIYQ